ncbi:MAG: hypothetical protein P4L79_17630 [Legionella sp.]|nr:hypothetical protein [Legionella sp.]
MTKQHAHGKASLPLSSQGERKASPPTKQNKNDHSLKERDRLKGSKDSHK